MKYLLPLFCLLSLISAAHADLSFAYEGDSAKRARLSDLQGSEAPPTLKVEDWMNGNEMTLESLKGKVVVLDFWATWCVPCIRSIPHTNDLQAKYPDDLVIIGICAPKGAEKMAEVVKEHGIEYAVAVDQSGATSDAYKVNGFPDFYVIDRSGKLVVADCQNGKVGAVVEQLLSE